MGKTPLNELCFLGHLCMYIYFSFLGVVGNVIMNLVLEGNENIAKTP
jgi:hypothetical protein